MTRRQTDWKVLNEREKELLRLINKQAKKIWPEWPKDKKRAQDMLWFLSSVGSHESRTTQEPIVVSQQSNVPTHTRQPVLGKALPGRAVSHSDVASPHTPRSVVDRVPPEGAQTRQSVVDAVATGRDERPQPVFATKASKRKIDPVSSLEDKLPTKRARTHLYSHEHANNMIRELIRHYQEELVVLDTMQKNIERENAKDTLDHMQVLDVQLQSDKHDKVFEVEILYDHTVHVLNADNEIECDTAWQLLDQVLVLQANHVDWNESLRAE
jgi:hypothetical protein